MKNVSRKWLMPKVFALLAFVVLASFTVSEDDAALKRKFWGSECQDLGISGQGGQCVQKTYCEYYIFWIKVSSGITEVVVPCP